jgi:hypothetical protein
VLATLALVLAVAVAVRACGARRRGGGDTSSAAAPTVIATVRPSAFAPPEVMRSPLPGSPPTSTIAATAEPRLSRREVRTIVERVLRGRLPDRELGTDDYDHLTDAVLRLRGAARALRTAQAGSGAALDAQRRALRALDDIERITGVPTADLGNVISAEELAGAPAAGP